MYTYNNGNIVYDLVYEYSVGVLPSYPQSATQYLYENATWSDILTGIKKSHFDNGVEIIDDRYLISSDTIGNITNINGPKYSWLGRQLQSVSNSDNSKTTYSYNADGQRIAKAVNSANGDEYNYGYYYNGDILAGYKLVITKSDGSSTTHNIAFMYDENGEAFGIDINGKEYFYVKNAQNDVIAIVNSNNETVATYRYDSWGKLISCDDISENQEVSFLNPYTYRSYYYDSDTEMYFLKSRYYNPELCRFISADSVLDNRTVSQTNIFSYCANNPVNFIDTNGHLIMGILLVVAIVGGIVLLSGCTKNEDNNNTTQYTQPQTPSVTQTTPSTSSNSNRPVTAQEKSYAATVYAEAGGQNKKTKKAVAHVMHNRIGSRKDWQNIEDVLSAKGQFSGYGNKNYNYAMDYYNTGNCDNALTKASLDECLEVVIPIYRGEESDFTGGAMYFHSLKSPNDWAYNNNFTLVDIPGTEGFWFYK